MVQGALLRPDGIILPKELTSHQTLNAAGTALFPSAYIRIDATEESTVG